mgnify:CR=1 FL=1
MKTVISELLASKDIILQLTSQQLILRYRRTFFGYLWTLINPILMMTIMAIVFSTLFKSELKDFSVFLFSAMIPWTFFSSVVTQSGGVLIQNEGLIKKIYLPKIIFPLSISFALLIDSILSFVALFTIIIAIGGSLSWNILYIIPSYILLYLFSLGIGLTMSIATVFFRDLQHVILIAMQGLFFLTPIFYKHDAITGNAKWLLKFNPVVPFIDLFRIPIYYAAAPSTETLITAGATSLVAITIGVLIFKSQENKIIFRL